MNFFFVFQSLTHFQPYIEESLGGSRERTRGHFPQNQNLEGNLPGILPPPAKMFAYDNSGKLFTRSQNALVY